MAAEREPVQIVSCGTTRKGQSGAYHREEPSRRKNDSLSCGQSFFSKMQRTPASVT